MAKNEEPSRLPGGSAAAKAAWKRALTRRLLAWYRGHRRDLPWRQTSDPYRIWVSEIMLQQTQVVTVVPYFLRFVAAMPTVEALAAADEHEVLRLWEGLGYYRRARQMHRAARVVVEQHGGLFPREWAAIRELPGIGRYTAGAIASIAFDEPAPILEANTVRLLSRLIGYEGATGTASGQQILWRVAEALLPTRHCGQFNQALMELGSLLCMPRMPLCDRCPLAAQCEAARRGQQDEIPRRTPGTPPEAVREAAVAVWRNDKLLLRRRAAGERWAGLWDFMRFPLAARRGSSIERELLEKVREQSGLEVSAPRRIATLKHSVTRFRITLDCFSADCEGRKKPTLAAGAWQWVGPSELDAFPLSVTGRKMSRLLLAAEAT